MARLPSLCSLSSKSKVDPGRMAHGYFVRMSASHVLLLGYATFSRPRIHVTSEPNIEFAICVPDVGLHAAGPEESIQVDYPALDNARRQEQPHGDEQAAAGKGLVRGPVLPDGGEHRQSIWKVHNKYHDHSCL